MVMSSLGGEEGSRQVGLAEQELGLSERGVGAFSERRPKAWRIGTAQARKVSERPSLEIWGVRPPE